MVAGRTDALDWPTLEPGRSVQCVHLGSAKLRTRRANHRRAILGGKREISLWRVEGDDTFVIMMRVGKHRHTTRLTGDALDALIKLRETADGPQVWRFICRVSDVIDKISDPAKSDAQP